MVLQPRVPVIQDVLCKHDETSGAAEAGVIVCLSGDKKVARITADTEIPFGLLGQKVKSQMAGIPANYQFPGEIGTAVANIGDEVLVYHDGIFETDQYKISGAIAAGTKLFACVAQGFGGKLSNDEAESVSGVTVAVALESLSAAETAANKPLLIKLAL